MSATDTERLDTFMPELADQVLGHLHAEASGSFRAGKKRRLVINPGGTFYDFITGSAGRGAITRYAADNYGNRFISTT
jgi:hypothetical protein